MREAEFRAAIADPGGLALHPRFGVYRNNVGASLANALRVRYPMVAELIGRHAFADLAGRQVARALPVSPVLIDYGADFPGLIAASGDPRHPPFLADLARLESLWWQAYHAADAVPAAAERFGRFDPADFAVLRLKFLPSAALLRSRWPVGRIWERLHAGQGPGVDVTPEEQTILVWRPDAEVLVRSIDQASAELLAALMADSPLAEAVEAVAGRFSDFDLARQLQMLIASRLVADIVVERTS